MSRSTSHALAVIGPPASSLSRTLSLKTNTRPALPSNPLPPAQVKLFVTNLRLLGLDNHADWPNITVQKLSARTADQKQRIAGVEWALFRLFELWDPAETAQKLQPFFPPLEPLQSLNLRAALYRCLNDLKKNGVLGRESVLRKTMLDECKGDKFFDILATFSTAVLKKVLATSHKGSRRNVAIARKLSVATSLRPGEHASLLPLAMAHKAALSNLLQKKEVQRRSFAHFGALLDAKAAEYKTRLQQSKATPTSQTSTISEKEATTLKQQLKDVWIGDENWLDTLLYGDQVQAQDAFLDKHFDEIWPVVEQGRRLEDMAPDVGLLENLDCRVREQQARLQKWKLFHEKLYHEQPKLERQHNKSQPTNKHFEFHRHLQLQLHLPAQPSADKKTEARQRAPSNYDTIVSDMHAELRRLSKISHHNEAVPQSQTMTSSSSSHSQARLTSYSDPNLERPFPGSSEQIAWPNTIIRKKFDGTARATTSSQELGHTSMDSDATLIGDPQPSLHHALTSPTTTASRTKTDNENVIQETSDPLPTALSPTRLLASTDRPPSPSSPPSSYWPSEPPVLEPSVNSQERLAEQIISSIDTATPSPIKKPHPRPSLFERTRMSMAYHQIIPSVTESSEPTSPLEPRLHPLDEPSPALEHRASLVERTRLSMTAAPLSRRGPKKDTRKKTRTSLFPISQFDTPRNRKSFQALEEQRSGGSTPKEELFSDDMEYERVFRSRPRVAHSPIFSPEEHGEPAHDGNADGAQLTYGHVDGYVSDPEVRSGEGFDEGVTGVDLADVVAEDENGFMEAWEDSPSRNAGWNAQGKTVSIGNGKGQGRKLFA